MAKAKEPTEEALTVLVREALAPLSGDGAEAATAAVMEALRPVIGASAQRRRDEGLLRNAFRDGFLMGKSKLRMCPWHISLWKCSPSYGEFKRRMETDPNAIEARARYARYNED